MRFVLTRWCVHARLSSFPLFAGFPCLQVDTALGVSAQGLPLDCAGVAVAPVGAADRESEELAERGSHAAEASADPPAAAQRAGAGSAVPDAAAASGAGARDSAQPSDARGGQQPEASTSGRGGGAGFGAAARGEREALASGGSVRAAAQKDQREVADKLIAVFQERDADGWRRLIASSRLWTTLADGCAAGPTVCLWHNICMAPKRNTCSGASCVAFLGLPPAVDMLAHIAL